MKKPLIIFIIALVIILILPAIGFFGWYFEDKKPIDIVILDKTVHSLDREKHRSLTWVLSNSRIVKKDSKRKYFLNKDYYGFFPVKPLRSKQFSRKDFRLAELPDIADNNDALYYADTYGVFVSDWYKGISRTRNSRKLYGGLNNNDYLLLSEMKKRNKLVILEYNTFDYPTDAYERYRVEELIGFKSTGWSGKYYPSLDSSGVDVPLWIIDLYKKSSRQPWDFKNAGIILLKGSDEILVMEEGRHLENALPFIMTEGVFANEFGLAGQVAFDLSFEIIEPRDNQVLSNFKLRTLPDGDELLDKKFLSNEFPAVIANKGEMRSVYFCGDFATGSIPPWTASLGSLDMIKGLLYENENLNDPRRFFWLYYKPLVSGIMNDYYLDLL